MERRREAEREQEMGEWRRRRRRGSEGWQPVKSQVFMTSAQICVLTSVAIAASLVM